MVTDQSGTEITDNYSGNDKIFTYAEFEVIPEFCPLSVTCSSITGASSALKCVDYEVDGSNQVTINLDSDAYNEGEIAPGKYTFTYDVTTGADATDHPNLTKQFEFELTLTDPCDPPISIGDFDELSAQTYIVTDTEL